MPIEELQSGRYRRLRSLGSGGMGEVHLMQDTRINRPVAIKVTRSESDPSPEGETGKEAARLFQREARAIGALEHSNILPLYDFGEEIHDGSTMTYMVMPFCPDGSLADWIQERSSTSPLSLQDIASLIGQAAQALQYAHDHKVIHLDVKPSNFLLRKHETNPNRPTLLLADFGVARSSATIASSSRTIRGTPMAMAPEHWGSNPVAASDQYALAIMTYELLTGRPPFIGSLDQLMIQHLSVDPVPPSKLNPRMPAASDEVILRALAKKPEDRFPSITAFAAAFEQAIRGNPAERVVETQQVQAGEFRATVKMSQAEAQAGISCTLIFPGGQRLSVAVPAGTQDGQIIRLQGLGEPLTSGTVLLLTIALEQAEATLPLAINAMPTLLSGFEDAALPSKGIAATPTQDTSQSESTPQFALEQTEATLPSGINAMPTLLSGIAAAPTQDAPQPKSTRQFALEQAEATLPLAINAMPTLLSGIGDAPLPSGEIAATPIQDASQSESTPQQSFDRVSDQDLPTQAAAHSGPVAIGEQPSAPLQKRGFAPVAKIFARISGLVPGFSKVKAGEQASEERE